VKTASSSRSKKRELLEPVSLTTEVGRSFLLQQYVWMEEWLVKERRDGTERWLTRNDWLWTGGKCKFQGKDKIVRRKDGATGPKVPSR
jgi:hypothetical protein